MIKKILFIFFGLLLFGITIFSALANHDEFHVDERVDDRPVVGRPTYEFKDARISFIQNVRSNRGINDLKNCVESSPNRIKVDTVSCPDLNVPASITFYDVKLSKPALFRNGIYRPDVFMFRVNATTVTALVPGFSEWTLQDNHWGNGTFTNTTMFNGNLQAGGDSIFASDFETSASIDRSTFGNNPADIQGATFDPIIGRYGSGAFYFDGVNDDINYPFISAYNVTNNQTFTIVFDVRNNLTGARQVVIDNRGSNNGILAQIQPGGAIDFFVTAAGANSNCIALNTNMSDGFHRVALVYNYTSTAQTRNIFVDGAFNWSCSSQFGSIAGSNKPLIIGSQAGSAIFLRGVVDNFMFFNRSLNESEILQLNTTRDLWVYKKWDMNWTSQIFNVSDYIPTAISNNWKSIHFEGNLSNISVYGRSGSSVTVTTNAWTLATNNSGDFNFTPSLSGTHFQFKIEGLTDANKTFSIQNFTILSDSILPVVNLPEICNDEWSPKACTLYAPHMNCGQLDIYNTTNFILNASLLNLNENISYYVFNQSVYTEYIIKFCDNTTKYIVVGAGDDSMALSIVIGLTVFIILFIVLAVILENVYLKLVSMMMAMGFSWVLYALLLKIAEDIITTQSVVDVLVAGYKAMVYSYIVIFALILLFMLYKLMMKVAEAAKSKR